MNYWLVKSEPGTYSWDDFTKLGRDHWDGVRNYQARNNIREMRPGDLVFFYHSVKDKEIVGVAKVVSEPYPDPTADSDKWTVVDMEPERKLPRPVTLAEIKADERLTEIALIKQSRLSVMPLKKEEFETILTMSEGE